MLETEVFLHIAFKSARYLESILLFHDAGNFREEVFNYVIKPIHKIVLARDNEMEKSKAAQESPKNKRNIMPGASSGEKDQLEKLE